MLFNRLISPLIFPLTILIIFLWLGFHFTELVTGYLSVFKALPYVLFTIIVFLSIQFNQLRSFLISVVVCMAYFTIQSYLQTSIESPDNLNSFFLLSTSIPILVLCLSWIPDKGVFTASGLLMFVLLFLTTAVMFKFYQHDTVTLVQAYFPVKTWSFSILSTAGISLYLFAFLIQIFRLWLYKQPFDAVMSVLLLTILGSFIQFNQENISILTYSASLLIIIWGILKQSHNMAYRDELTGLPGRRALNEILKSPGRKYVLAMMDIDHFKKFNDKYGHDVGDDVLKVVASKIGEVTGGGKAFRYGGEEFTIFFKGKSLASCVPHLEAVREEIAAYQLTIREKTSRPKNSKDGKKLRGNQSKRKAISVTISIGVADKSEDLPTPENVMKAADKALYKAKKAGRNCLMKF